MPISKGWLRASLRRVDTSHPAHREYLPYRSYLSTDVQPVKVDEVYTFDVEIWPTNVVIGAGGKLVLEVASHDTQGSGIFEHNHPEDRVESRLKGWNNIHVGGEHQSCLILPVIPS